MRYVIAIRRPAQPVTYYLSKSGFRCYDYRNAFVTQMRADAEVQRRHFAAQMPDFELAVEQLPENVRSLSAAILASRPVEA